jgi:PAS domain S-box-containing protein
MNPNLILKNILTSGLSLTDPDLVRRFRVLNIFQLVFFILSPALGLFYYFIGMFPLFFAVIIAGFLMLCGVFLLRLTKNIILSGNYAVFILWAVITVISWNTGAVTYEGVINPSWLLNAVLILLAIFLNGYLSGTVWAAVVFIQTGTLIYMFRSGHEFQNLLPAEIMTTYYMAVYLISLLGILIFAFLFEKEKSDALIREQEKSHTLRESKRYMDDIFDRYPLPTFVLDKSHRVIQWNRACQELSGIYPEQILGKRVWEGFFVNDTSSIADMVLDDINSIGSAFGDSLISDIDSGWFEMDTFLPRLKEGKRAIVTAAPITDNNGIMRGAIQTIQEVRKIPVEGGAPEYMDDSFPQPVFRIDSSGKIDFWNKACEDSFGFGAQEMIGKNPLAVVANNYRPLFKDTMIRVLKGESFTNRQWKYSSAQGKPVYVLARVFPAQSADEKGVECVIVNTDITEIRLKLKKLSLYAAESNEKLKVLSEEHDLLKKNIATFIRKKDKAGQVQS